MALAKIYSGATVGLDPVTITVEVNIEDQGFPAFQIVGLPGKAVEESKERVRSAIKNSGAEWPRHRITVNLAPADLPKKGPSYDLPIALGILVASGQLTVDTQDFLVFGELSLDGSLRSIPGVLPMAILAREKGFNHLYLSHQNAKEASIVSDINVYPVDSLISLFRHFTGVLINPQPALEFASLLKSIGGQTTWLDFKDIKGQESVKRALEVAAAGGHNILMNGVPGSGKTLLARSFVSILPYLTMEEALEATKIHSITGNLSADNSFVRTRPFRSPHHTTSRIGLIGGGTHPSPGEVSLAHRGVLFLDEFPEFPRSVLESLRQPLEDGVVTVSRAAGSLTFPAKFILVAAQNPCPCGYKGHAHRQCVCTPYQVERYRKRVSGPLLDRIDLHLEVAEVEIEKLAPGVGRDAVSTDRIKTSAQIQEQVQKARDVQSQRFKDTKLVCNADMGPKEIEKHCSLLPEDLVFLQQAVRQLSLSARGYHRTLKMARTAADLAGEESIDRNHLNEALGYRQRG